MIQWRSSSIFVSFSAGHCEQKKKRGKILACAGMSTLWCCLSSISFAYHSIAHPSRCPEGWFGETDLACDMPKPCKFPSLDNCQKRFLQTHKKADIALHPVVGLVLEIRDAQKSPQALRFKSLDPFFQSQHAGSMFHSHNGWRWQETCTTWTCLWSWWCCTARSCLVGCVLLLSRCSNFAQGCSLILETGHLL